MNTPERDINAWITEARGLLASEPGEGAWSALVGALERCPAGALELGLDYLDAHLGGWPEEVRVAPQRWVEGLLAGGERDRRFKLVRTIVVPELRLDGRPGEVLAAREELAAASILDLSTSALGRSGVAHFAARLYRFEALRELRLNTCRLGGHGAQALAIAAPPSLRRLQLDSNFIGAAGLEALLESPLLDRVEALSLRGNTLNASAINGLSEAQALGELRHLHLDANLFNDDALATLLGAPWIEQLESLGLAWNFIGDRGALALARCGRLERLRHLDLSFNNLTREGLDALAAAPWRREGVTVLVESRRPLLLEGSG